MGPPAYSTTFVMQNRLIDSPAPFDTTSIEMYRQDKTKCSSTDSKPVRVAVVACVEVGRIRYRVGQTLMEESCFQTSWTELRHRSSSNDGRERIKHVYKKHGTQESRIVECYLMHLMRDVESLVLPSNGREPRKSGCMASYVYVRVKAISSLDYA